MAEIIQINEIEKNIVAEGYKKLKAVQKNSSSQARHGEAIRADQAVKYRRMLEAYSTNIHENLQNIAEVNNLDARSLLEYMLDQVFERGDRMVNFGRLLQEYGISLNDVTRVKDYVSEQSEICIGDMLVNFILLPYELEIVLALLYAEVDDETLKSQFDNHPSTYYQYENDPSCQDAISTLDKIMEEAAALVSVDHSAVDERIRAAEIDCRAIEATIDEVQLGIENLKENVNTFELNFDEFSRFAGVMESCDQTTMELLSQIGNIENVDDEDKKSIGCADRCETNEPTNDASLLRDSDAQEFKPLPVMPSVDVEPVAQVCHALPLRNAPPDAAKPELKINDKCYATRDGKEWHDAIVVNLLQNEAYISFVGNQSTIMCVPKSRVAYYTCPDWLLPVGCRIIVQAKPTFLHPSDALRSGTVAEPPSFARNGNRYLIFFDNSEAQYVDYTSIRCICKAINRADDIEIEDPKVKAFVLDYVQKYPERAVVRLKVDQCVKVLYKGVFCPTKVIKVDFMMAYLLFRDNHVECLYRGDKRLEPIASRDADLRASIDAGSRRHHRQVRPSHAPVVEFLSDDDLPSLSCDVEPSSEDVDDDDVIDRPQQQRLNATHNEVPTAVCVQTARKSTRGPAPATQQVTAAAPALPLLVNVEETELIDVPLSLDRSWKSPYSTHSCSPYCLVNNDDPALHKGQNPLLIPMITGWDRLNMTITGLRRRCVVYDSPCSKRFTDLAQVAAYLRITQSRLTIDLFCFDLHVRPSKKMTLKTKPYYESSDYSNGNENVPIECVNSYTDEHPHSIHYQSIRYTTEPDVDLNLASEFLSGCDCEDDCLDASHCACQQLTKVADETGYEFRRLPRGYISTGIFECNDLCKCKKSCSNRVVQNPLTTCLQLFKTAECGWGVRTLYDIPKGAFICVYAGNILSDEKANEVGKTKGDEYFADLDFVLHTSDFKEGFEEQVVENDQIAEFPASNGVVSPTVQSSIAMPNGEPPLIELSSDDDDDAAASHDFVAKKPKLTIKAGIVQNATTTALAREQQANEAKQWSIKDYIGEENVYTLDAKLSGNIGRFLNHSCAPNVFVQNVFVDTHVLTLPWVALFAEKRIRAGSELCWDYSYTVGSVPDKQIKCMCRSNKCRGRLL